jgi:aspartate carbamoyltransferase catalytic subunit
MPIANPSELQLTADGRLRHLLTLHGLDRSLLTALLDQAESLLSAKGEPVVRSDALRGKTVANLFFESSTRTRASFEIAAKRMGADVVNLDIRTSSTTKGETILDTIYTLQAMHVDVFVIRAGDAGTQTDIAMHVDDHVSVLNAGDSNISHPTQGLLDLLTIRRHKGNFEDLTVTIVGDVAHSRVARSAAEGLSTMGVGEMRLVSPPSLAPEPATMPGAKILTDLDEGLRGADVVMALRIQKERIQDRDGIPDGDAYFREYGISHERMKLASPDAIVMHPGPMNRGVEIESSLADGPSSVITDQVANGVAIRMAVLDAVAGSKSK